MKKTNKKNRALIVLVVLLIALAIGYAAFQTVLTVNGTATGDFTWNVHFTNDTKFYEVTNAGAKGDAITDTDRASVPFVAATTTNQNQAQTLTATVTLNYPGDAVILETVIKNDGTQPAKLTGFTVTGAENGLVISNPTVTYGETDGEVLNAGKTCKVQFLVKWNPNSATFGDETDHEQEFQITFTYKQDTVEKTVTPAHDHQS